MMEINIKIIGLLTTQICKIICTVVILHILMQRQELLS